MDNTIKVPAQLSRISRRADKSVNLSFITSLEISPEQMMVMDTFHQSEGWLVFKENEVKEIEIPKEDADLSNKTQSQRLRDTLYRVHESTKTNLKWEEFYKLEMDRIIEHYKSKI